MNPTLRRAPRKQEEIIGMIKILINTSYGSSTDDLANWDSQLDGITGIPDQMG